MSEKLSEVKVAARRAREARAVYYASQADLRAAVRRAVEAGAQIKEIAEIAQLTPQRVSQINLGKR